MQVDFGGGGEIAFFREGRAGIIRLARPKALNALNEPMVEAMAKALQAWEDDASVSCILVEGDGRAFCSGGDIVAAWHAGKAGHPAYEFFEKEYALNAYIGRYSKPYVAFMDGIVMGGGAGISVHGSHRIVTENTVFAMPETAIGFYPDAGAGAYLPSMPYAMGAYLALTGNSIKWGDCLQSGIATHAIALEDYDVLRQALIEEGNPRPALEEVAVEPDYETDIQTRTLMAECFSGASVEDCLQRLQTKAGEGNEFAIQTLTTILARSPISVKVAFRHIVQCQRLGLDNVMAVENRITRHMIESHDFYEGIRALLIDKDKKPQWQLQTLEEVDETLVDVYFQANEQEENIKEVRV
ncbi:MAG: 3-hydroxyisobutyryl-CoA hydrolase [Candidatus Tokpelaia hoelldobleri]|uniref:3-hydroxyisobutyryl-CoA hydrolase n=1 Tax=Candidatus Tokpelaia hoelldobleri TaxID=1902579 RepID=A0A1U9JUB2_9HYPH|nr:MAG: 3-hydroxyisobutyryl-CoA hydrolase [Candidatus Tokpelaia hoelldoblerii]